MSEQSELRRVWSGRDLDPKQSRPVDLAEAHSEPGFEPVALGRTPWPSDNELAAIRELARREGLKEGRRQAQQEASQQHTRIADELAQLIDGMRRPYAHHAQTLTREVAKLAIVVGTALFRRALDIEPSHIVPIVSDAVEMLASSERQVLITLHPLDAKICRELLTLDEGTEVEIRDDETLERGGFYVSTEVSEVNATVRARVDQLIGAMFESDNLEEVTENDKQSDGSH